MNKKIFILGSSSIDHTVYTEEMPSPGVTGKAISFFRNMGGKGANQACAAHYLGGDVFFLGAIGKDEEGRFISSKIEELGFKHYLKISDKQTGIASITTNVKTGENQILIVQGANLDINKDDIYKFENIIKESHIFLTQLENSYEAVETGLKLAKKHGLITILNPAPYMPLEDDLYQYIDYFIPNEHEMDSYVPEKMNYEEKGKVLLSKGVKNVIITLGENGSLFINKDKTAIVHAIRVKAIDTTAAGDSYIGALVTAMSKGKDILEAMKFASKCSAITVTRKGAIASLPKIDEIK